MHPGRLIMDINVVQNDISDKFYFDYKAVQLNLTKLIENNEIPILWQFGRTFRCPPSLIVK